jgi:hypothetical protein
VTGWRTYLAIAAVFATVLCAETLVDALFPDPTQAAEQAVP